MNTGQLHGPPSTSAEPPSASIGLGDETGQLRGPPSTSAGPPAAPIGLGDETEYFRRANGAPIGLGDETGHVRGPRAASIGPGDRRSHLIVPADESDEISTGAARFIASSDGGDDRAISTPAQDAAMSAKVRLIDAATARSSRIRSEVGRELRDARHGRSLSQLTIARAIRLPQSTISEIERGVQEGVTVAALARFAAAVGLDLSVRLYPAGEPIRDAAHERLLSRFRSKVGERWDWAAEVPLPIQGDRRAWDRLLRGAGVRIGVEAETKPSDLQELQRRLALKKRDGGVDRLVLVLPDTDWCRRILRLNDLTMAFPIPGKVALGALQERRDPGGDAVILI